MDIKNYISSGILEAYCLGQLSNEDMIAVDQMAIQYEEINQEINRIFESLELYVSPVQNEPLSKNKVKVFNDIYKLDAGKGKLFPPLIETQTPFIEIKNWLDEQKIITPTLNVNQTAHPLPSDQFIENFLAWVKLGHDEEIHFNYNEHLVIIEGSCNMYIGSEVKSFKAGDIISIEPNIAHKAIVTSAEPMLVLVQKQFI